jgi:hypothetical protein
LGEDIFEALMVSVDIAHIAQQIMSPDFQSMNNYGEFQVMHSIIHLMFPKLARGISNYSALLHKNTSQTYA